MEIIRNCSKKVQYLVTTSNFLSLQQVQSFAAVSLPRQQKLSFFLVLLVQLSLRLLFYFFHLYFRSTVPRSFAFSIKRPNQSLGSFICSPVTSNISLFGHLSIESRSFLILGGLFQLSVKHCRDLNPQQSTRVAMVGWLVWSLTVLSKYFCGQDYSGKEKTEKLPSAVFGKENHAVFLSGVPVASDIRFWGKLSFRERHVRQDWEQLTFFNWAFPGLFLDFYFIFLIHCYN